MPVVSGASSPDGAAATCFGCAGAGCRMIILFVSALRSFCADLALAAWDDVDHAPVAKADKAANCQGGMIAVWEQFALRNCERLAQSSGWLSARTVHRSAASRLREITSWNTRNTRSRSSSVPAKA